LSEFILQVLVFVILLLRLTEFFLYGAVSAFAAELRRRDDRALRGGHAHDLVGDTVRRMLERIVSGADFELRLNGTGQARGGWLVSAHPPGRKEWELAEVPRAAGRFSSRAYAFRAGILLGVVMLVLEEAPLPQQLEHCLITDAPLKHE
jgi:hypothetical protein